MQLRRAGRDEDKKHKIEAKCFAAFLTLTYLVFPGASATVFQTFLCDSEFDDGASYLKVRA